MFTLHHRFIVPADTISTVLALCERTEDRVWLSKTESCIRYTLRGVPARLIDLRITEGDLTHAAYCVVVEIGRKAGKFDNAERWAICLRRWPLKQKTWREPGPDGALHTLAQGRLLVTPTTDAVAVVASWDGGSWGQIFPALRADLADYNLARIVMWHWQRYYSFLPMEDVRQLADAFEASHPELKAMTLAEANRLASRDLYRFARDLGWRKLTLRERTRLGLDSMWVPAAVASMAHYDSLGIGQYTAEAAGGLAKGETPADGIYPTAHGTIEVEV